MDSPCHCAWWPTANMAYWSLCSWDAEEKKEDEEEEDLLSGNRFSLE